MTGARRWRVATANIRHGLGPDGRVDLARTAAELRALDAEVIGLQEVDVAFGARSGHRDQAAELAELLGMDVAFGPALDRGPAHQGGPHRCYGVAVLTVHELLTDEMHLLPTPPAVAADSEPRGVLRSRLRRADGAELEVWVTHLDHASRAHRTAQVQGIIDLARAVDDEVVLMGDMNADPRSPELAALAAAGWREAAQLVDAGDGSRDARARAARVAHRASAPASLLRTALSVLRRTAAPVLDLVGLRPGTAAHATHPAHLPIRRIDLIWLRGRITATSLAVGPRGSSDHRPVVADLRTGA